MMRRDAGIVGYFLSWSWSVANIHKDKRLIQYYSPECYSIPGTEVSVSPHFLGETLVFIRCTLLLFQSASGVTLSVFFFLLLFWIMCKNKICRIVCRDN